MANKQRGFDVQIADRENLLHKNGKKATTIRPLVSSRPALGEVGNKIGLRNELPGKPQVPRVESKISLSKAAKVSKDAKPANFDKENDTAAKKVGKIAELPSKTHKQQESVLNCTQQKGEVIKSDEVSSYSSKQLNILDPDVSSEDDPQMVVEYLTDIFNYLRELEEKYPIKEKYLDSHQVTPRMRGILVNWLVEVHNNFKLCVETLHLCISIMDRYLQASKDVGRETLQLVGTSAMLVASKYEEMYLPELSDFVYICDDVFSAKQILQMEIDILKKLDFSLGRPLSIHFLRRFSKIAQVKPEQHALAKYLLELALLDYGMCHIKPSIQAAASSCLSVAVLTEVSDPSRVWTPTLVHYTTYKYSDFKTVIVSFAHLLNKAELNKNQSVRNKYATSSFAKISLNSKLKGPLIRKLTSQTIPFK